MLLCYLCLAESSNREQCQQERPRIAGRVQVDQIPRGGRGGPPSVEVDRLGSCPL
jgi:hypothetical protein